MSLRHADWLGWFLIAAGAAIAWGAWLVFDMPVMLPIALAVQVLAGLVIYYTASRERRGLASTLAASVPVIGPVAAIWLEAVTGRGGADLLVDPAPVRRRMDGSEIARRLVASLPPCEAIIAGDVEARRATIGRLVERASADDIAILRWAHRQPDSEISLEAALALEEIGQRFEQRLRAARAAANTSPTPYAHAEIVFAISDAVRKNIVDSVLVPKLLVEARRHYLVAVVQDSTLTEKLAIAVARLELAARQPARALGVLRTIADSTSSELIELRREAAYATRRFDELPPTFEGKVLVGGG